MGLPWAFCDGSPICILLNNEPPLDLHIIQPRRFLEIGRALEHCARIAEGALAPDSVEICLAIQSRFAKIGTPLECGLPEYHRAAEWCSRAFDRVEQSKAGELRPPKYGDGRELGPMEPNPIEPGFAEIRGGALVY